MSLSPVKKLVLETVWMLGKPVKPIEVASEIGLSFPTVMMHMLGLTKKGYLETFGKGYYAITRKGKEALGLPEINGEKAEKMMANLPVEKAFHFYVDVGKPLNVSAASLMEFCEIIQKIDEASLEFHLYRGDFEAWLEKGVGDVELAKKFALIRERKIYGENLRRRLYEIVKNRCEELAKIQRASTSPKWA